MTSGKGCIGCGPQEHFYGCSDISIESNKDSNSNTKKTSTSKLNHLKKTSTSKLIHIITKFNKKSKQH